MSKTQTKEVSKLGLSWQMMFAVMLSAAVVLAPDLAFADDPVFGTVFCAVVGWFTGNVGRGLATLGVTIIGIGALLGKVSWGMALIVGTGVAIIFGAGTIVANMGAEGAGACEG